MQIEGLQTEVKSVVVDVPCLSVVSKLWKAWFAENYPEENSKGWYVDHTGQWCKCTEYYHGSDSYDFFGAAPADAIEASIWFTKLDKFARTLDKKGSL